MGRVEGKAEEPNFVLRGCRMVDTSLEGFMDFVDSVGFFSFYLLLFGQSPSSLLNYSGLVHDCFVDFVDS